MKRFNPGLTWLLGILGVCMGMAGAGRAQGILLPRPCGRPVPRCPAPPQVPQEPLKVKSIRIKTKITDQVAVTHVEQVFENDTPFLLEGVYFFPLPEEVSITEFAMWDGSKRLAGEVRSREEARRIYDEIVRSRRDPGLLEYAGKNLFQASIFPIPPNSEKKIELTYSQVLRAEAGTVAYRYPLGTGWRANGIPATPPRPIPMQGPRRDFDREPRPAGPGVISAEVEIASRVGLKGVYSPSHEIDLKRDGERKARLSFETRPSANQRDFQLFYTLSDQEFGVSLLSYREPGKDGYFLLLVSPKAAVEEKDVSAKEVIFVLDTSGSMSEAGKMDKARAALRFGVNALAARDRFNIVSFAGEEHLLAERPMAADEAGKKQALEFIEKMRPTGGTNINDALLAAFKQLSAEERPKMVVLITDGQPTVGEIQAARIQANAQQANQARARLFTFGVGYDVNTALLDALANDNRGTVGYIEPNEDIEIQVSNFFRKVNHPVLSDLGIDWGGLATDLVYPKTLPDLFDGSQLVLVGRYRAGGGHGLTLTGKVNGRERRYSYKDLAFAEKATENDFLPHLWAIRRVGHLLDQIRRNGEARELRDEIVDLGTRYGIVTPYTSYLVLEPGVQVGQASPRTIQNESVTVDGAFAAPAAPALSQVAGRDAVAMSKSKERMRRADTIPAADAGDRPGQIRQAAGKTFYLRDGVWTDSELLAKNDLPVVTLTFSSDAYFALLAREPGLANCLALGKRVAVAWKGTAYRIQE